MAIAPLCRAASSIARRKGSGAAIKLEDVTTTSTAESRRAKEFSDIVLTRRNEVGKPASIARRAVRNSQFAMRCSFATRASGELGMTNYELRVTNYWLVTRRSAS